MVLLMYILAVLLGVLAISLPIVRLWSSNKVKRVVQNWKVTLTKGESDIEFMLDSTHFVSDRKVRGFCDTYKLLVSEYE